MKALPLLLFCSAICGVHAGEPAPLARLHIPPSEVLETKEHDLGDRKIILQKVVPQELPAVPEQAAARAAMTEGQRAEWRAD